MIRPNISVIIPLYNKEKSIRRTIESLQKQTFQSFEIVIVNDGSTDNSVEIVNRIDDDRIRLINQDNAGPGAARNTGVKNAQAEWIVFLDADDELLPDALEYFYSIIQTHEDVDIIDCNKYNRIGDTLQLGHHPIDGYVKNPFKECFFGNIGPGEGHSAFRCSLMLKYSYDERIRRFEDAELLIRLLNDSIVYSTIKPTMIVNCEYSEASSPRKDVYEDYFAYLDFETGGFWRKMCVYRTFLEERILYPEYGRKHYKRMYYRYDLLLCYKILNNLKRYL